LNVLALEPYCGGSHGSFLDGYRRYSRHSMEILGMPARKWKWRMRGGMLQMLDHLSGSPTICDVIFASDYLDAAAFRGLAPAPLQGVRIVVYFHENQLTYPLPNESRRDYQFGFTNITTCLAADRVVFNSHYHMRSFLEAVDVLLQRMPDCVPPDVAGRIADRSEVVPVGVDLGAIDAARPPRGHSQGPLRILWNQRWEYDKNPEAFFRLMMQLGREGVEFELAVLGESFRQCPGVFEEARRQLGDRIVRFGYVGAQVEYYRALWESDVVVSTALQEFFGIAVVEAMCAGCAPLLPDRLSYPELLPGRYHAACLYRDDAELRQKLRRWALNPQEARSLNPREDVRRFSWGMVAPRLDRVLEQVACDG